MTAGQTSAQDRQGSRARPSGSGAHREPGSFLSAWRAGRGCGACFHGVTGLLGRALGRLGAPSTAPHSRGSLPTTQCTAPQSVLGFHTTPVTSGRFWRVHLTPPFRGAASCGPSPQPAPSFRGGTTPATHHTPCSWAWRAPGSWDGLGAHSAGGRPPAWCEDVYTPASPTGVCFLHRSEQMPSRRSPASAGRAVPYGGCLVCWSPAAGSCGDRPPPRLSTVACAPRCPHVGLSDTPGWLVHRMLGPSPSVETGWRPHLSCCVP